MKNFKGEQSWFLSRQDILESFDHSNSLKFLQTVPKTYVIQMWCTNCRDNVLNFEFVLVPKSPSYTTYEKWTISQEHQLMKTATDYSQILGYNSTPFALHLVLQN